MYTVKIAWEPSPQLASSMESVALEWVRTYGYPTLEDALQAASRLMAVNPRRRVVVGRAGR